jgi:tRNA pseudouridine55 synthase
MERNETQLAGVLVVDKPAGPTSHDVVDAIRRALGVRRVGHTGTLDPFATGVLPVCVGRATRLARLLAAGPKEYRARVRLGFSTTTDDATGKPVGPTRSVHAGRDDVEAALAGFVGDILQVPPTYSAKRVSGRRLYEMAREGAAVPREASAVSVYALDLLSLEGDRADIAVRCSPGTYIRALARDLGEALGTGGHLESLRRTRSGPFAIDMAVGWDELAGRAGESLIPLAALLKDLPCVTVGPEGRSAVGHGRDLDPSLVEGGFPRDAQCGRLRVLDGAGELLAVAVPKSLGGGAPGSTLVLHPEIVLSA